MRVKKGHNNQPITIPQGFTQSGQAVERPGLTVARIVVTLIPFVGRESSRYICKTITQPTVSDCFKCKRNVLTFMFTVTLKKTRYWLP